MLMAVAPNNNPVVNPSFNPLIHPPINPIFACSKAMPNAVKNIKTKEVNMMAPIPFLALGSSAFTPVCAIH